MADPCPRCGAELDYDEVDIGVGVQRGNYRCTECGWDDTWCPRCKGDGQVTPPGLVVKEVCMLCMGTGRIDHLYG